MHLRRIRQLDGVRALAILSVMLNHTMHVKLTWMGVDLFFILSGFLITGVLLDARTLGLGSFFRRFYARRARRILIPYVVFLALATIYIGTAWMRHWYFYILLTNLLLPLGVPHPGIFEQLWSLAVEEQFYLVWPFAVYFLDRRHLRKLCIFLIVLAPVLRGSFHFAFDWPIYELTPFRMDLLAVGGLLCIEWRDRQKLVEKWGARIGLPMSIAGVVLLALLADYGYSTYGNSRLGNVLIYEACLLICLGIMLFALGGKMTKWLESPPLRFIGKISYTMYLVHPVFIAIVLSRFQGIRMAGIAFVLTVAYASLSWYAMERFLLSRGKAAPEEIEGPAFAPEAALNPSGAEAPAGLRKIDETAAAREFCRHI